LITEKSEQVKNEALDALNQTFIEHHAHFSVSLWKEIFSQVILPVLEDIRLQIELAIRKNKIQQAQLHLNTLESLLSSMNQFFSGYQKSLPQDLVTQYTDVLCLFASNINN
jgi:hypothetical protein